MGVPAPYQMIWGASLSIRAQKKDLADMDFIEINGQVYNTDFIQRFRLEANGSVTMIDRANNETLLSRLEAKQLRTWLADVPEGFLQINNMLYNLRLIKQFTIERDKSVWLIDVSGVRVHVQRREARQVRTWLSQNARDLSTPKIPRM